MELCEILRKTNSVIQSIPDIIYRLDEQGKITFINDAIKRYGYEPDELIGTDIFDLINPEEFDRARHHLNERRTGDRRTQSFEVRLFGKDHQVMDFDIRLGEVSAPHFLVIDSKGTYDGEPEPSNFTGSQGIARDITELKRAEEKLNHARSYAQSIVNSSLDIIVAVDRDRHIIEFNNAACEAFGYTRDEAIGKHVLLLYADKSEGTKIAKSMSEHGYFMGEIQNQRKNGEIFSGLLSATVMRNDTGEIIGTVGSSRDMTAINNAK